MKLIKSTAISTALIFTMLIPSMIFAKSSAQAEITLAPVSKTFDSGHIVTINCLSGGEYIKISKDSGPQTLKVSKVEGTPSLKCTIRYMKKS